MKHRVHRIHFSTPLYDLLRIGIPEVRTLVNGYLKNSFAHYQWFTANMKNIFHLPTLRYSMQILLYVCILPLSERLVNGG